VVTKLTLGLVLAAILGASAHAHPVELAGDPVEPVKPVEPAKPAAPVELVEQAPRDTHSLLGFALSLGAVPVDHRLALTYSIGLSIEHPVFRKWRVFGDYEWMWLERVRGDVMPIEHGDGQRVQVGVRRRLAAKAWHELDWFIDGELGGGFTLASDNVLGVIALPDALAGVRFGYDLHDKQRSDSQLFVCEFVLRALGVPTGAGMTFAFAASWK
jgi:hypothetical protein